MQCGLSTADPANTQTQEKKEWDGLTLEEAIREAVRAGSLDTLSNLIKALPAEKRDHYRAIAKDEIAKARGAK